MKIPFHCPHCSRTVADDMKEGEGLFATKTRLRIAMGESCPRTIGRDRCPMREGRQPVIPTLLDFEVA